MQLPLQITIQDIPHSAVLEEHIRKKVHKLNSLHKKIMACRVVVEVPQKHRHQGKLYNVRIDLTVPGEELAVNRNPHEDAYVAVRDAFENAERLLGWHDDKQHGDGRGNHVKLPLSGKVVRLFYSDGYGFIEAPDGHEVYFHHSIVKPPLDHLSIGAEVHFLEEMGNKGPQASRVRLMRAA